MHTMSTYKPKRTIRQVKARQQYRLSLKNRQHKGITLRIIHTGHNSLKHPGDRGISYRLLSIYLTSHNVPFTSRKYTNTDELAVAELSAKYHPNTHLLGECPYTTAAFTDNCGEQKHRFIHTQPHEPPKAISCVEHVVFFDILRRVVFHNIILTFDFFCFLFPCSIFCPLIRYFDFSLFVYGNMFFYKRT